MMDRKKVLMVMTQMMGGGAERVAEHADRTSLEQI